MGPLLALPLPRACLWATNSTNQTNMVLISLSFLDVYDWAQRLPRYLWLILRVPLLYKAEYS